MVGCIESNNVDWHGGDGGDGGAASYLLSHLMIFRPGLGWTDLSEA